MASMQSLQPAVILMILSVFLISIGIIISHDMGKAVATDFIGEVELENITYKNVTPPGSDASLYYNVMLSDVEVRCSGTLVDPTEIDFSHSTGFEICYNCSTGCTYNNTNCSVYGYANTDKSAFAATNATKQAIGNFTDWFPLIIIVIATAIILGIVIRGFSGSTAM